MRREPAREEAIMFFVSAFIFFISMIGSIIILVNSLDLSNYSILGFIFNYIYGKGIQLIGLENIFIIVLTISLLLSYLFYKLLKNRAKIFLEKYKNENKAISLVNLLSLFNWFSLFLCIFSISLMFVNCLLVWFPDYFSVKKGDQIITFSNLKLSTKVIISFFSKFDPKFIYLGFLIVMVFIFSVAFLYYYINYPKILEKEYKKEYKIINKRDRSQKLNNFI